MPVRNDEERSRVLRFERLDVVVALGLAGLVNMAMLAVAAKLFHGRDCGWARRIPETERVYFKRVAEAREAGFSACPVCEPWEPAG
jgi:manganese transport protein